MLTSNDEVSPQTLIDLCNVHGWAAVWVPRSAGSSFPEGHVQVFYRPPGKYEQGKSRMIYADYRGVRQIEELAGEVGRHDG